MSALANPFLGNGDAPETIPGVPATEQLWSVTELLDMGKPTGFGIKWWLREKVAVCGLDERDVIDAMLKTQSREQTVRWIMDAPWRQQEKDQDRGKELHTIAERLGLGLDPGPIDPTLQPYVDQLERWIRKWRPEFLMAEAPVYNLTHRYAGTCDGIMRLPDAPGHTVLFDYKTTEKPPTAKSRHPYPEVALQLAAYAHAEFVGLLADRRYTDEKRRYYVFDPVTKHEPMPPVDAALAIVVTPHDCFARRVEIGPQVFQAFRDVMAVARWAQETSKGVLGATLDNATKGDQ